MATKTGSIELHNGTASETKGVPVLSISAFRDQVINRVRDGAEIAAFFAAADPVGAGRRARFLLSPGLR